MTHISPDSELSEARSSQRIRTPAIRPKVLLGWAGATAVVIAGGALAAVTFTADDEDTIETPTGRTDTGAPPCVWVTQVDGPVVPEELLGAAPTPESVLAFEMCDGDWTGDMAWLHSGEDLAPAGDDGLPNP